MVGFVAMVLMIIAPQGSIALVWTCPHRWGPLEIGEVSDEGKELVIGDVERSELGGLLALFQTARQGSSDPCSGCSSVRMSL